MSRDRIDPDRINPVTVSPVVSNTGVSAMVLLAAIVSTIVWSTPVDAQWTTQSPVPTHLSVSGVAMPTTDRIFAATADDPFDDGGALFESADGGAVAEGTFLVGTGAPSLIFTDGFESGGLAGWGSTAP